MAVKFDLKKDIDLTNAPATMNISIRSTDYQFFGSSCFDGVCETDGMVIVPNTTTCTATKVEGTTIKDTALTSGMTLAPYFDSFKKKYGSRLDKI